MPRRRHRRPRYAVEPFDPKRPAVLALTLFDRAQTPGTEKHPRGHGHRVPRDAGLRIDAVGDPEKGYRVVIKGRFHALPDGEHGETVLVVGDLDGADGA